MVVAQKCHSPQSLSIYFIGSLCYGYTNRHLQLTLAKPDHILVLCVIISACTVFPRQSLQPLINVGVNIMEFVNIFLSKFSTCLFIKIFPRQNFVPYGT